MHLVMPTTHERLRGGIVALVRHATKLRHLLLLQLGEILLLLLLLPLNRIILLLLIPIRLLESSCPSCRGGAVGAIARNVRRRRVDARRRRHRRLLALLALAVEGLRAAVGHGLKLALNQTLPHHPHAMSIVVAGRRLARCRFMALGCAPCPCASGSNGSGADCARPCSLRCFGVLDDVLGRWFSIRRV